MNKEITTQQLKQLFPSEVFQALAEISARKKTRLYLAGGSVRDLILHRQVVDIDLTVEKNAIQWAEELSQRLSATLVPLGRDEDAARVVWKKLDIDFSSFREGADTIEKELKKRDITINSLAVLLDPLFFEMKPAKFKVIDPVNGIIDLENRLVRMTSQKSFRSDPLRMLRVFRFAACFDFAIDEKTLDRIEQQAGLLSKIAAERIAHELDLIMASDRAHDSFATMAKTGLLWQIIPELQRGVGMDQPASHHLDVFEHSLAALDHMECILAEPQAYFTAFGEAIQSYLARSRNRIRLKWAALLHDIGKPATYGINEDKNNRITFYNHDQEGAKLFTTIAMRLKMSREDRSAIAGLISHHMWPFHLNNVRRKTELSLKAKLKITHKIGEELLGLFLLCMADTLAGQGSKKPEAMEQELRDLLVEIDEVRRSHVQPVLDSPPLITGKDLIDIFNLEPGPFFRQILEKVHDARMEKRITTRKEALQWVEKVLLESDFDKPEGTSKI